MNPIVNGALAFLLFLAFIATYATGQFDLGSFDTYALHQTLAAITLFLVVLHAISFRAVISQQLKMVLGKR